MKHVGRTVVGTTIAIIGFGGLCLSLFIPIVDGTPISTVGIVSFAFILLMGVLIGWAEWLVDGVNLISALIQKIVASKKGNNIEVEERIGNRKLQMLTLRPMTEKELRERDEHADNNPA